MHRLFVALTPPPVVRDALIDTMEGVEGARWQSDEQLHLTLRWVGEVDPHTADDLAEALEDVRGEPFELAIRGVGHFDTRSVHGARAKAVWAAVAPSPALDQLQRRVERACRSAGLPPETRKFLPHITLARLNASSAPVGEWMQAHGALRLDGWRAERFTLYESFLSDAGSDYVPVVEYPLR